MNEEHDKGNPPPSMSSRDGMPVDVIMVDSDDGDRRVPRGIVGCFEVVFLLKEDMVVNAALAVDKILFDPFSVTFSKSAKTRDVTFQWSLPHPKIVHLPSRISPCIAA